MLRGTCVRSLRSQKLPHAPGISVSVNIEAVCSTPTPALSGIHQSCPPVLFLEGQFTSHKLPRQKLDWRPSFVTAPPCVLLICNEPWRLQALRQGAPGWGVGGEHGEGRHPSKEQRVHS